MQKLFPLMAAALLLLFACNNNNQPAADANTETATPATTPTDSPSVEDVKDDGATAMPAQVFDDESLRPVTGANVTAIESGRTIATGSTNANGFYSLSNLVSGRTYTYTCTKSGYIDASKTAVYEGDNSLPWFAMKKR